MKLYSHGLASDLRAHLQEVMSAAETPEERIVCACHDIGKATVAWQAYIVKKVQESPHNHAAAGGLLAALLLLECQGDHAAMWALVALHTGAAHHSAVQQLGTDHLGDLSLVASDRQVKEFFLDSVYGIASLLPDLPKVALTAAWERFCRIAPAVSRERAQFNQDLLSVLSPELRLQAYLRCRFLLARLCFHDHVSAARQSGKDVPLRDWQDAFPEKLFVPRICRLYPPPQRTIDQLRTRLREAFLQEVCAHSGVFYFIDAPTGLGKTEAMLQAAELLVAREHFRKIVYAVPQISVADQVFEDYFANSGAAQIWDCRRHEKTLAASGALPEPRVGNGADAQALEIEQHPFSESYNVTTFNQVLLAMCHPGRFRCIRSLGLQNAVVILDEFHKLPQVILPFFFRFAREYGRLFNCRFILGSATPLEPFPFWDLQDSVRIPANVSEPLYRAQEINQRRSYRWLGRLNVAELGKKIVASQRDSDQHLLVVVNLIGDGSWPLRKYFGTDYQPWQQLEELKRPDAGRIMVWLDGLVPPGIRRDLVVACQQAMKRRPVTLISTQMIEVGVDLDFDAALIDYQGLAATIQRGGRVGRNGRPNTCPVDVFSLVTEGDKSSFERLLDVQEKYNIRLKTSPFDVIYKEERFFNQGEIRFIRQWNDQVFRDSDLTDAFSGYQKKVFSTLSVDRMYDKFFFINTLSPQSLGASFEKAQFVAELFDPDRSDAIVVVESQDIFEELSRLNQLITSQKSQPEDRRRFISLQTDRTITPSPKIKDELGLSCCGYIDYPERIGVYRLDSLIF